MKKIILSVFLVMLLSIPAFAADKSHGVITVTTSGQVFTRDVVIYGWKAKTDGTNALQFELYDNGDYRGTKAWKSVDQNELANITPGVIDVKNYVTTSSTDRMQKETFPLPIQTTNGGVYIKFYTSSNRVNSVTLYYDYSKYRVYD